MIFFQTIWDKWKKIRFLKENNLISITPFIGTYMFDQMVIIIDVDFAPITKKILQIPIWSDIINKYNKTDNRMYDQDFLRDFIYPIIKNNSTVHASFHKKENHAKKFPINYCKDFKFVGEYVYSDESRSLEHVNILKNHCNV